MPNVATVRLSAGQWQPGRRHAWELRVVDGGQVAGVPAGAGLLPVS
ncbi:hypothetical protein RKE29_15045 [Streptomyces sp. B1866]|nr:hypothetical protein [Streptomyces sp. B1866]MDT3397944.1 hypothetical protein [Streptomyces sp. B1866]